MRAKSVNGRSAATRGAMRDTRCKQVRRRSSKRASWNKPFIELTVPLPCTGRLSAPWDSFAAWRW